MVQTLGPSLITARPRQPISHAQETHYQDVEIRSWHAMTHNDMLQNDGFPDATAAGSMLPNRAATIRTPGGLT